MLTEIASRALSPAVNDPGTAIDVIGRGVRILSLWAQPHEPKPETEPACSRVFVRGLKFDDMLDDFFGPIAQDGANLMEVGVRLQKALAAPAMAGGPEFNMGAKRHAALAFRRAELALPLEDDVQVLRDLESRVGNTGSG